MRMSASIDAENEGRYCIGSESVDGTLEFRMQVYTSIPTIAFTGGKVSESDGLKMMCLVNEHSSVDPELADDFRRMADAIDNGTLYGYLAQKGAGLVEARHICEFDAEVGSDGGHLYLGVDDED